MEIVANAMHPEAALVATLDRVVEFGVVAEAASAASFERYFLGFIRSGLVSS